MKKNLIIIPTYNELENIQKLLKAVFRLYPEINILVVDDNSPDGTGDYIQKVTETDSRVHIIRRLEKMGLGTAYVAGFKYMIENGYDLALQMDADFSHDPKEIKNFLAEAENSDLVIGSRYIRGVNIINWSIRRLLLSYIANRYTMFVTGMPIKDATGGYKCFRREVLEAINLDNIHSNGYSFQIEMNFKAWKKGFKITEIPIIFTDRVEGTSKMSKKIVCEAVLMVWKLRFRSIFGILR